MDEWEKTGADRALTAYLRAVVRAEPIQTALLAKYGIRLPDMRALRVLRDDGPMPISHFADALGIGRSTATGVVDRLEERGLIERAFGNADRRTIAVRLTPRGLTALEDRAMYRESAMGRRIAALPAGQQRHLAELLEWLIEDDAEQGSRAPEAALTERYN